MRPSELLSLHRAQVREIALLHHVSDVYVFGSTARGEDRENSDIDLLVIPTNRTTLLDLGAIQWEVSDLLGIEVDVATPGGMWVSMFRRVLCDIVRV
jgi:predicted nucleotidyltransferase